MTDKKYPYAYTKVVGTLKDGSEVLLEYKPARSMWGWMTHDWYRIDSHKRIEDFDVVAWAPARQDWATIKGPMVETVV